MTVSKQAIVADQNVVNDLPNQKLVQFCFNDWLTTVHEEHVGKGDGPYLHALHTAMCSAHQVGRGSRADSQKLRLPLCCCHELLGKLSWVHVLLAPPPNPISYPCTSHIT